MKRLSEWFLPEEPDVLGLLHRQATVTLEGMEAFATWSKTGADDAAQAVRDAERTADDVRRELLRALSPIHRFDALRAPLLVVHGETDSNVPVEEAEQVVAGARARNVPVEYLLFREEGHELERLENKEAFVVRTSEWLAEQLAPATSREAQAGPSVPLGSAGAGQAAASRR